MTSAAEQSDVCDTGTSGSAIVVCFLRDPIFFTVWDQLEEREARDGAEAKVARRGKRGELR
jgi:hypothetical protein